MRVDYLSHFGDDLMVVNAARCSMSKWHSEFDDVSDTRLIHYLAKHDHWSPFAHPKIQLRLHLPIFIARQWEKHRVGALRGYDIYDHSEVSRRYVDDAPTVFYPESWRARPDGSIKQGSGSTLTGEQDKLANDTYEEAVQTCMAAYERLLAIGVAPEQARMVLPQSMDTMFIETGSLAYWARCYTLRADSHAQTEIQYLAQMVADIVMPLFPKSWAALVEQTL
jgi:thymidylate synthase (FAD)